MADEIGKLEKELLGYLTIASWANLLIENAAILELADMRLVERIYSSDRARCNITGAGKDVLYKHPIAERLSAVVGLGPRGIGQRLLVTELLRSLPKRYFGEYLVHDDSFIRNASKNLYYERGLAYEEDI